MGRLVGFGIHVAPVAFSRRLLPGFARRLSCAQTPDRADQNIAAEPQRTSRSLMARRFSSATASATRHPQTCRSRRRWLRTREWPRRDPVRRREHAAHGYGHDVDFQSNDSCGCWTVACARDSWDPTGQVSYRIDAPSASAVIDQPGEYRLSVLRQRPEGEIELAVLRGSAELVNDDGRTALRAGQRAYARADVAPSYGYAFNSASWDAFDRWSERRRDQRLGVSTQYLPSEVQPYASTLDQYGAWQYNTSYGYVWYPSVAVGWRPYYYGRWVPLSPVRVDVGRRRSLGLADTPLRPMGILGWPWFWIPGRSWAPAWVSWAYAPGT